MKVTMPTPCAYLYTAPSGARVVDLKRVDLDTPGLTISGLITVDQAEAYKDACVREAVESVLNLLHDSRVHVEGFVFDSIQALLPPLPGPASHNP
ncbi:hypothetical protein [Pusillimonas noertemannii]|uniref:Uncharacterized protein n=1 Tax=Pusillimonas noertemannii TaxID=305977 RepID=A0A2U1CRW5_9BURK|nr:hypothetical protein [Pusillimonas noertemannii]NYT67938.1 hypothetical protein [Pusillimonas noertemannii]PVY68609.1 hypothetical protein C7440_1020 [Pusillimonas noertemannii]TFL11920.1 hypothetical protein CSC72_01960 [Pusillimonas noertemannii]